MTVQELIELLEEMPLYHHVVIPEYDEDGDLCGQRTPQPAQHTDHSGPCVVL